MGFSSPLIDNLGHLGGALSGFLISIAIIEPINRYEGRGWKIGGFIGTFIYFAGGLTLFFTVVKV